MGLNSTNETDAYGVAVDLDVAERAVDDGGGLLGGLLGGLDIAAMMGSMGIEVPGPDDTDLDDVADAIDAVADAVADLTARVDWLAAALLATVAAAPGKFRPALAEYPPPVVD